MRFIFLVSILFLFACSGNQYPLDPMPSELIKKEGQFQLEETVRIYYAPEMAIFRKLAHKFANDIKRKNDLFTTVNKLNINHTPKGIYIQIAADIPHKQGYKIRITPTKITVKGRTPAGIERGIMCLLQLVGKDAIPCAEINDTPTSG